MVKYKKWRIAESFNICGINPWGDTKHFHQNLDQLNESGMYKDITDAHVSEVLDKRIEQQMEVIINLLTK